MCSGSAKTADAAAESAAASAAAAAQAEAAASGGIALDALVVSDPEKKHLKVHILELNNKPLFPGIYMPIQLHRNDKLVKVIADIKRSGAQAYVGAFVRKKAAAPGAEPAAAALSVNAKEADPSDHLFEYGTFAQVHSLLAIGDGGGDMVQLLLLGHRRLKRTATASVDPLKVHVSHLADDKYESSDVVKAISMEVVNTMRELMTLNPLYSEMFRTMLSLTGAIDLHDLSRLVDAAASMTNGDEETLVGLLENLDVPSRATAVLGLLKKELELVRIQMDIREQVETKIIKEQRRQLLTEQLKSIKKELGLEKDDKSALVQKFTDRWALKCASASPEVVEVVKDELEKLQGLETSSPEFNVTRNYLEWLTTLPWGTYSDEIFDVVHARKVLDDDHHGLDDVKERILEFIAVSRLRGSVQGKILCLVGPPGVGKTSIGRSIANTLHRKYYRFSVGGLYDVAEIKGHRRTYVGAMPGKMVQCLKSTGTSNPLVLIDEIDKLGRGHTGDPASALLELLDPEQNSTFTDHYMDVPINMSKVLFVCTANTLDTIPGPLLDRMEVIRLSGYAADEKRAIARKYLEPSCLTDAGIPKGAASLDDSAIDVLINEYCREAGVRNLKKHLEKVYRKVALKIVKDMPPPPPLPEADSSASAAAPTATAAAGGLPVDATAALAEALGSSPTPATASAVGAMAAEAGGSSSSSSSSAEPVVPPAEAEYTGEKMVIDKELLKKYVGQAPFSKDNFYDHTPPGVVMGLAWTSMGGATLYVETAKVHESESRGSLTTTGQLGDVFRESASIAHTYARSFLGLKDTHNKFFSSSALHVHVPAGATPKDGPSAGCAIITALLSLATNTPVRADLAMTGEVTLTGRVLPIGGVKEKVLAARRSGVRRAIFPEGNRHDFEELAADLKEGIEPHFVSDYSQIFKLAFEYETPFVPQPAPAPKETAAAPAAATPAA
ncbi:MAG: hypothetical protein WDW38_005920 [Sanguina aurantia]